MQPKSCSTNENLDILKRSPKTIFDKLDVDCQLYMLQFVPMIDIITLSRTYGKSNENVMSVIEEALRRRFFKKTFKVGGQRYFLENEDIDETKTTIGINNNLLAMEIISKFGRIINSVKIHSFGNTMSEHIKTIYKLIELHCTETLVELSTDQFYYRTFQNTTKPFKKVEKLSLYATYADIDIMNLSELFPSLRDFSLNFETLKEPKNCSLKFPHLKRFAIGYEENDKSHYRSDELITELIRENPQIQHLVLWKIRPKLLKIVADEAKNLETLEINGFVNDEKNIIYNFDLRRLKSFKINRLFHRAWPQYINFSSSLKTFEMDHFPNDIKYKDFFKNNKHLKNIRLLGSGVSMGINNEDIKQIAEAKMEINEIYLDCYYDVKAENIVELIENSIKLTKMQLHIYSIPSPIKSMKIKLSETLGNSWMVDAFMDDIFLKKVTTDEQQ